MENYDLVIIGSGGAGVAAAIKTAESGYSCAIIEAGTIGGTCVNVGCVPSKALLRAAEAYYHAGHHAFKGVYTKTNGLDWETVIAEKDRLVENLRQQKYIDVIASYPQITSLRGKAELQADGSVLIDGATVLRSRKILIATGAKPRILPLNGIEAVEVLTSTTAMELRHLPHSMIVIGGRFIALEQAQMFARFGAKVTLLQRSKRLIPEHEPEISAGIAAAFREEGLAVYTGVELLEIQEEGGEKTVIATMGGESREFRAEQVLMATGRSGNTENLGLDKVGVELNSAGAIIVNDAMQTGNPDIYAAGDVTNRPQLVYVAAAAGGIAAENALTGSETKLDLSILPEVIFTDPQIATVGLTEAQAKTQGHEVETAQIPLEYVPRAIAARNTRGLIKLVAERKTKRLLGAQVLAAEGGEIIQTAAMAIHCGEKYGFTVEDMRKMLFPYLTQVEGLKLATLTFNKEVAKLSCCAG
ncbi:MAG: mercury(II) reductase [SAR324 cluster bacterium]|nr:mercury(II) reductase [SAR324 cluster bacterium]